MAVTVWAIGTQSASAQHFAQGENQFGVSQTLFATLAAINAAGYDAGINSPLNEQYKLRTQIREELAKRKIPSLTEIRDFYQAHRKPTGGADLGQYVSFALLAGDPPKFDLPDIELPPDAEPLRPFAPLLVRFYKEANIEELWKRSQNAYAGAMRTYQDQVINTLFEANGYLRNPSGNEGRRFQVYLDLLGEPNQAQVRNYRGNYFVVVTPSADLMVDQIRDAYLTYLVDPLTLKYAAAIQQKRDEDKKLLYKYAQDAPALDLTYKDDFQLLVTKCMVKALNSRMMHGGSEKRAAYVDEAMKEGFILTAAFAEGLEKYERAPDAFKLYFPDLITQIDVKKERKRLEGVQFVQTVAPKTVTVSNATIQVEPAEQSLEEAEGLYEQRDLENAARVFKKTLSLTTDKAMQGRAYYGLARIAVRENRPGDAKDLFQRTADSAPAGPVIAWAHVYLGRIATAEHKFEDAQNEFKRALATDGISAIASEAAQKGLESISSTGDKQK